MPSPRILLVLGRASNLPTVWSNCLAGWYLGGGRNAGKLLPLMVGATLLYSGGMYLNDAFDADFDAQYRRDRPIPSGAIAAATVWRAGFALLVAGVICLMLLGWVTGALALLLALFIVLYDAVHKVLTLSPALMSACRFLLYLVASSIAADGVTGEAVWCGFALGAYVAGVSYIARQETSRSIPGYWPCLLLLAPIALALLLNGDGYLRSALLLSAVLALWGARCLRYAFGALDRNISHAVAGLLAGIVWVDLLAVADCRHDFGLVMVMLFLAALLFQRLIPAT